MKKSPSKSNKTTPQDPQIVAGRCVWKQYSFYGDPDVIAFGSEPVEQKLSLFETPRPHISADEHVLSHMEKAPVSNAHNSAFASRSSVRTTCSIPVKGTNLSGSIALHRGKYLLTDNGETIRELQKEYHVNDATLKRILGNMKTEQKVCVHGGELCIVVPDTKNIDRYAKDLALIIERLRLICRMTLEQPT